MTDQVTGRVIRGEPEWIDDDGDTYIVTAAGVEPTSPSDRDDYESTG